MNQQAVDYLQTNKDNYTKESLIEQLRNAGYDAGDITEAVHIVYGDTDVSMPLPNDNLTEENVKYAGFWIRWVAKIVDGFIVGFCTGLIMFLVGLVFGFEYAFFGTVYDVLYFCLSVVYFVLMTDKYQATLGKKLVKIKVCNANTLDKATFSSIKNREIISNVFFLIPLLPLLHVVVAFTKRKQGLHDMAAETVVVYKDSNSKNNGALITVVVIVAVFVMIAVVGILYCLRLC